MTATPQRNALPLPTQRALSRDLAAAYLDLSPNTFDTLVADGRMPKPVQIGKRKVWDVRQIDAAFDEMQGLSATDDSSQAANPWD